MIPSRRWALGPGPRPSGNSWGPGQRLFLYTDGLVEAGNATGAFFTLERVEFCLDLDADLGTCLVELQYQVLTHSPVPVSVTISPRC